MKKTILVLLCLATLCFPIFQSFTQIGPQFSAVAEEWKPERPATIKTTKKVATVHDCAYAKYPVIDTIANGEIVDLITFSPDGLWYRVAYAKGTKGGWVRCADLGFAKK